MRKLLIFALTGSFLVVALTLCAWLANMHMRRQSLPQKLQTNWFYATGNCNVLLSHQGAFAFGLRQNTIDALNTQGISFFGDIELEENGPRRRYFSNANWKETPVSDAALESGAAFNVPCGPRHSWFWPTGIEAALKRPGSFYTDSGPRGLFVIPSLGLVVASASDR